VFKEKRMDKKWPDALTTVERLAKIGTAPLEKVKELRLEPCPFWNHKQICPLRAMFRPLEKLRFPIKCLFATDYKCKWVKEYYYQPEEWELKEEPLEEIA